MKFKPKKSIEMMTNKLTSFEYLGDETHKEDEDNQRIRHLIEVAT